MQLENHEAEMEVINNLVIFKEKHELLHLLMH